MTEPIIAAIERLENLEETMREFENAHESLFNQRREIAGAIDTVTAEIKELAKAQKIEDLRHGGYHVIGSQSMNHVYDIDLLVSAEPMLEEKGVITKTYKLDEKKLLKFAESGVIDAGLVESAKRFTPRAFAVRVEREVEL